MKTEEIIMRSRTPLIDPNTVTQAWLLAELERQEAERREQAAQRATPPPLPPQPPAQHGSPNSGAQKQPAPASVADPASSAEAPPQPKRGRGAPKGNRNAYKIGYYSRVLSPESQSGLDDMPRSNNLENEIATMRIKLKQLLADPNASIRDMNAVARTLTTFVGMRHKINTARVWMEYPPQ